MYKDFEDLLLSRNLTAYKVCADTGIAQSTISDWKNGKSTPKVDKLMKLASYFNVPLETFLQTDDGKQDDSQ